MNQFKCDKCDRSFPQAQGLRMHKLRKHSRAFERRRVGAPEGKIRRKIRGNEQIVRFCPCCGTSLAMVQAALTFGATNK